MLIHTLNKNLFFILFIIFISYLLINTGIISDDFNAIEGLKGTKIKDVFFSSYFMSTPVENFSHYFWYYFFPMDNLFLLNIIKTFYILLSFFLVFLFFSIYLSKFSALCASFLFIFFPTHDSTVYFFMGQYLTLSFAFYLYSFYLAYHNKLVLAFILGLIASFISYGSTPIALALFTLFFLNKEFKKGMAIIIPNLIYAIYFVPLNIIMRSGYPRIIEKLNIAALIKQFILQILSFIDAMLGPSFWLKVYYSFSQLSGTSFLIGVILIIIFYKQSQKVNERYNLKLIISCIVLLFSSFLMFAATGRYPQLAFNLGNRVTIYGSLILAYFIVLMPSKAIKTLLFSLLIFTILGISDHWKIWNLQQQKVIGNIRNNYALKSHNDKRAIYVSGNQYSKYGPISNIEFFSEDWVVDAVFKMALGKDIFARSINKRYKYIDGYLIDTKYSLKTRVDSYIYIYDSEKDILFKLKAEEINNYIDSLSPDTRHWLQILDIKLIKEKVLGLMPRLRYAF